MIPILYSATEKLFTDNGIGAITDAISCLVTEERNGAFELEMVVPTTSPNFSNIIEGNIIYVQAFKNGTRQAFEIDKVSKPIDQKVSVHANHISYRASYVPIAPFIATGITATIQGFTDNAQVTNDFTITTDFTNQISTYNQSIPKSLRACLGGTDGSVLDTFGGGGAGEYEWDNYTIKFWQHRGSDNDVYLRYRKNITAFDQVKTIEDLITGVLPYWTNDDESIVLSGSIQYSANHSDYPTERIIPLNLSEQFQTEPSAAELNLAAQQYLTNTSTIYPNTNIKLSFIDLADSGDLQAAENINLCDTVHIIYEPLNITFTSKVIKTVWDALAERYESIDVGNPKSNIAQTIATAQGDISSLIQQGKKLVSVTQTIDREIGQIQSTVATVQDSINEVDTRLTQRIDTQATQIQQNASEIVLRALKQTVDQELGQIDSRVILLETYVSVTPDGLTIKQNNAGSYVLITSSGMEIYVDNQQQAYATTEGFYASTFLTGDWHIQPANNGNSLNFFKKGA